MLATWNKLVVLRLDEGFERLYYVMVVPNGRFVVEAGPPNSLT